MILAVCATIYAAHAADADTAADGISASHYEWHLPRGFPRPAVPFENPMSSAKVVLGRRLFFETRLSSSGRYSCSSCHRPEIAFTDGRAHAQGATGERAINDDYLEQVIAAYEHFFFHYTVSDLLVVNTSDIDFVQSHEDFEGLLSAIGRMKKGVQAYHPVSNR